jgi:hypothetical protein
MWKSIWISGTKQASQMPWLFALSWKTHEQRSPSTVSHREESVH